MKSKTPDAFVRFLVHWHGADAQPEIEDYELFETGLLYHEKGCPGWMAEIVDCQAEEIVSIELKDKPEGCYEIVGTLHSWAEQSYEGDWDTGVELHDAQVGLIPEEML